MLFPSFFFFNDSAPTGIYTLSLHDALPILVLRHGCRRRRLLLRFGGLRTRGRDGCERIGVVGEDRKSTRLNSSHVEISYAVFCLKKKKRETTHPAQSEIQPTDAQRRVHAAT